MMSRAIALVSLLVACSSPGGSTADPDAPPGSPDGRLPDALPGDFEPLVTAAWTLNPGQEGYICATKTLTEDIYAGALRPIGPPGTHHTVIGIGSPSGPDNPSFPCGPSFGEFWASGLGTQPLVLPDGVGLLAPAGSQLRLSLHLFNASDVPISGTSGLEIKRLARADVVHEASVSYHGPLGFSIPPNGQPFSTTNQAALGSRTIVAIFPHMHQLGRHFRARLVGPGPAAMVLWDEDYQFESQEFAPLPSIPATAGQMLETTCTWVNTTGAPVSWGDSSTAEMCFSILMTY